MNFTGTFPPVAGKGTRQARAAATTASDHPSLDGQVAATPLP